MLKWTQDFDYFFLEIVPHVETRDTIVTALSKGSDYLPLDAFILVPHVFGHNVKILSNNFTADKYFSYPTPIVFPEMKKTIFVGLFTQTVREGAIENRVRSSSVQDDLVGYGSNHYVLLIHRSQIADHMDTVISSKEEFKKYTANQSHLHKQFGKHAKVLSRIINGYDFNKMVNDAYEEGYMYDVTAQQSSRTTSVITL